MHTPTKADELRQLALLLGSDQFVPIIHGKKSPYSKGWNSVTPEEVKSPAYQNMLLRYGNTGLLLGADRGGLCAIDCDNQASVDAWLASNPMLKQTTQRLGARGLVFLVCITDKEAIPRNRNFAEHGEWKAGGTQAVVRGQHPSGLQYTLNGKKPLRMKMEELKFPEGWEMSRTDNFPPQIPPGGGPRGTDSSALCILDSGYYITEFASNGSRITIVKDFERYFGKQGAALYSDWVLPSEAELQPGQRNALLTHEIVPRLFDKCGTSMILTLTAQFYHRNQASFHDSLEAHQHQAKHVINCLRARYLDELTPREAHDYNQLNDLQFQDLFRICRSLAFYHDGRCPEPPCFFMSCKTLAARLGLKSGSDTTAHRMLRIMQGYGILAVETKGTRRRTGEQGKSTCYRYLLDDAALSEPGSDHLAPALLHESAGCEGFADQPSKGCGEDGPRMVISNDLPDTGGRRMSPQKRTGSRNAASPLCAT